MENLQNLLEILEKDPIGFTQQFGETYGLIGYEISAASHPV